MLVSHFGEWSPPIRGNNDNPGAHYYGMCLRSIRTNMQYPTVYYSYEYRSKMLAVVGSAKQP